MFGSRTLIGAIGLNNESILKWELVVSPRIALFTTVDGAPTETPFRCFTQDRQGPARDYTAIFRNGQISVDKKLNRQESEQYPNPAQRLNHSSLAGVSYHMDCDEWPANVALPERTVLPETRPLPQFMTVHTRDEYIGPTPSILIGNATLRYSWVTQACDLCP